MKRGKRDTTQNIDVIVWGGMCEVCGVCGVCWVCDVCGVGCCSVCGVGLQLWGGGGEVMVWL